MASTPCEVMEIATSDLVCVAREQDSLALFGKMLVLVCPRRFSSLPAALRWLRFPFSRLT
eukprot:2612452-Rhodomonas_salina.1